MLNDDHKTLEDVQRQLNEIEAGLILPQSKEYFRLLSKVQ
jgi:hypothetical protein